MYNPSVEVVEEVVYNLFSLSDVDAVSLMSFSQNQVQEAIKSFNVNKVASPDNIPMMLFIHLALSLSLSLSILFNKSVTEGTFPSMSRQYERRRQRRHNELSASLYHECDLQDF